MNRTVLYVHGQGGSADEAKHYEKLFSNCKVVGLDYHAETPWDAEKEFSATFDELCGQSESVILIANSIGAYFSMIALSNKKIERAYFVSPVVDMPKLIEDMMMWANVSENELFEKGEIETDFGQTLSYKYLDYARRQKNDWQVPTHILYGERDNLTAFSTVSKFAEKINATLTVFEGGEHWFHTEKQMEFLDGWIKSFENKYNTEDLSALTKEQKKRALYDRQKQLLDTFLACHAITKAQYDKNLGDLTLKMGYGEIDS